MCALFSPALARQVALALAAAGCVACAVAAEAPTAERPARQPLIEVASFGAAPVSGIDEVQGPRPRPGDIIYRSGTPAPDSAARQEIETRTISGESWSDLLQRVDDSLGAEALRIATATDTLRLLPPILRGKYVRLRAGERPSLVEIDYVVSAEQAYAIAFNALGVQVSRQASDPRLVERVRSDPAKASLFTATDAIGLPEEIVLQLVEIFSGDVDFLRELHYGYRCTIAYEVFYREGHIDRAGKILAVEFVVRGRRLHAYWFDDGGGNVGYYTETGKSMRKVFRRLPVEFSRVTSGYTLARFHPVLGLWRAHRGTDYAAPIGTRVLATSKGVVDFIGERGDFGNLVILRHQGRFLTYYAHLSGFAPDLAVGNRIDGGQVIGYVGATGLVTGPHLHYEFRVQNGAGEWVSVPPPEEVEAPPVDAPAFFSAVQAYRDKLEVAASAHFVILD